MIFEKIVSEGIVSNSYFLATEKSAIVIDPRRDCDVYISLAQKNNVKIEAIFDTHRNEDFVNGSVQLAYNTNAEIYHGHKLNFKYGKPVKEGDKFVYDELEFGIIETPGHTPESISITVTVDSSNSTIPYMVFTGDTLFSGEVGRIDFYRDDKKQREAAQWLYNSLFDKLLKLGDGTLVFPAHGEGSICGAGISGLPFTSIGYEKKTNPRLQLTKEDFIDFKSKEKFEIAPNMRQLEEFNLEGPSVLKEEILPRSLTVEEVKQCISDGAQIIDIREPECFAGGFIPKSINIWQNGLPTNALWMLDYTKPIVLIKATNQDITPSIRFLIRLGFDNIIGYLDGFRKWYMQGEDFQKITVWSVHELQEHLTDKEIFLLDIRTNQNVQENGKIRGSKNIFFGNLYQSLDTLPNNKKIVVYCDSGFKTFIGASYLLKHNFKDVTSVFGSIIAWKNAGYPFEK